MSDVAGTPKTRSEANSRRIQRLWDELESLRDGTTDSFANVEDLFQEQQREIERLRQRIRRLELFIGEFGAGDDGE